MTDATRIEVNEELLTRLFHAQLDHLRNMLNFHAESDFTKEYGRYRFGDDGHDDLSSALDLANVLRSAYYESDLDELDAFLNTPVDDDYNSPKDKNGNSYGYPPLAGYACDGICQELYDLNCPAFPRDY